MCSSDLGSELWDFRLVDPDNRRAVDYERRDKLLGALERTFANASADKIRGAARALSENWHDSSVKLFVVWSMLGLRRDLPELFARGSYVPVKTEGPLARQLCAFARTHENGIAVAVVPRLIAAVDGADVARFPWDETRIVLGADVARPVFRNLFTGEPLRPEPRRGGGGTVAARRLFAHFPVALLVAEPA